MVIDTSTTHAYGELQMVDKKLIIDNNPRSKHVHGEFQILCHNAIDVLSLHTDYGEINHLYKLRCLERDLLH